MFRPGPNAQTGIELARQGRKVEALAYLRRAVTSEPATAEVWLWLAHVTSDLNEYQNSVQHALRLEPDHLTARRMKADLDYQAVGMSPPLEVDQAIGDFAKIDKRQKRWRRVLILLNAILIVAACGR